VAATYWDGPDRMLDPTADSLLPRGLLRLSHRRVTVPSCGTFGKLRYRPRPSVRRLPARCVSSPSGSSSRPSPYEAPMDEWDRGVPVLPGGTGTCPQPSTLRVRGQLQVRRSRMRPAWSDSYVSSWVSLSVYVDDVGRAGRSGIPRGSKPSLPFLSWGPRCAAERR
jgi:hypothetical protein